MEKKIARLLEREEERLLKRIEWLLVAMWTLLGYFIYHGVPGAVGTLLLAILFGFCTVISLIPFVGVIIQGVLMYFVVEPWVLELTGLQHSWLFEMMFYTFLVIGAVMTFLITADVLHYLRK